MDRQYRPPRRIDRMGVELEGAWKSTRLQDKLPNHIWHGDGTVEVGMGGGYEDGEIVSPPLHHLGELQDWVRTHYPDAQNHTCGTHVHVSVLDLYDRRRLSTEEFYEEFLVRADAWAKSQPMTSTVRKEWFRRYNGENQYCCPNFEPCDKPHNAECEHECGDYEDDASCREHECEHECESDENMSDALHHRSYSCLSHSCAHDHDEECCSIAHAHGEDEDCECDDDDCQHDCESMDCFDVGDCQHECDRYCYSDCQHDCDDDSEDCRRSDCSEHRHHPATQREEEWDSIGSRYAHLNFAAEATHGTLEIRLAPAFCDAEITAAWVAFIHDFIEEWLAGEAPGDRLRARPANVWGLPESLDLDPDIITLVA